MTADVAAVTCARCGASMVTGQRFCESCGAPANGSPPAAASAPAPGPTCVHCGALVGTDGYCTGCGTRALTERDHWVEDLGHNLAGVCDKGVVHARNEDAMAVGRSRGVDVLVVCDGVTSASDSDKASIAAARGARDVLVIVEPAESSVAARIGVWADALQTAATVAQREVVAVTRSLGNPAEPPSCTFVAAVVDTTQSGPALLSTAWLGDSRTYWLPDVGDAMRLSIDDSLGTEMIAAGMDPAEAERRSDSHVITRWLGVDAPTTAVRTTSRLLDTSGWVLVCSDGLWNYVSAASSLRTLVNEVDSDIVVRGERLVAWANAQGGHDNITVVLRRVEVVPTGAASSAVDVPATAPVPFNPAEETS
jgi:serine/threonine protein phosphatase PrpC